MTFAEDLILLSVDNQGLVCVTGFWAVSEDSLAPFPLPAAPCPISLPHVKTNTSQPSHLSTQHDTPHSSPVPQILFVYSNVLPSILFSLKPNWPEDITEQLHCSLHYCCWSCLSHIQFHHIVHSTHAGQNYIRTDSPSYLSLNLNCAMIIILGFHYIITYVKHVFNNTGNCVFCSLLSSVLRKHDDILVCCNRIGYMG